ncbi:DUF3613 domain-containing protein [Allopusillimonas soli]|uniref:DUF3613 domain-containing protein n=1 Tax=Allopusillimonas soli TaxID=659016 RepID=A0A853FGM4_9BURK|nr:DUF3613 domain-containing protein [Allopusillimonas soli]NYT38792.1 DUF3613 domain-containing protein [Allopusillimonas soli]TEA70230.1 DUF3613 domain-containing protein [Allopusillimonas soli]
MTTLFKGRDMPRLLIPLCIALSCLPLMTQAQDKAPLTGRMAAAPVPAADARTAPMPSSAVFTPAEAYPVSPNTSAPSASTTARRGSSPVVTQAPPYRASSSTSTSQAGQQPSTAQRSQPKGIWGMPTEEIGDVAHALFSMQAQGSEAGNALPTLGATAGPAYKRYVDSFSHPLPEWFKEAVEQDSGN